MKRLVVNDMKKLKTHDIAQIEEELNFLSAGEYEAIVRMHDAEYFQDFV